MIEIIGDGKADTGKTALPAQGKPDDPDLPTSGVITLFAHRLCGSPDSMLIRRRPPLLLQGKAKLSKRVELAKIRAADHGDDGLIYAIDSEGKKPSPLLKEMVRGRDSQKRVSFPTAVGVAHPCIEAWLLADGPAIQAAFNVAAPPIMPADPEAVAGAPKRFPGDHYKRLLATLAEVNQSDLSAAHKSALAQRCDVNVVRTRCKHFGLFADEIESRIAPLFKT